MIKHRIKLFFVRFKWRALDREKARAFAQNFKLYPYLRNLRKELEEDYNKAFRKNPTHDDTIYLKGKKDLLDDILSV